MRLSYWIRCLLPLLMVIPAAAQQTNDTYVSQQQYLFDVHNIDDAWTYTTGSAGTSIGIYSQLGFIQNHEDLSSSRLLSPQGGLLVPDLDYASEMAGIVGASTNNSTGMAGIDRAADLQSYSILRSTATGANEEEPVTFTRDDGSIVTYYLDLRKLSETLNLGRTNGIDVHLFSFGVPSGSKVKYGLPQPEDTRHGGYPDPEDMPTERKSFLAQLVNSAKRIYETLCFGSGVWPIGSCYSPPNPLETFRTAIGNAVVLGNGVVVAPMGDLNAALDDPTPFLPAMMDKYAVAVGGIKYDAALKPVAWDRTRRAGYVDVAGFAEGVVGLSGAGSNQYNTNFRGTAAGASIAAGVAGLLKAENSTLSGEDIEEILKRTAYDVDVPGDDDATGSGAIDAGAALSLVGNNDVQRAKVGVSSISSDYGTGEFRRIEGYSIPQGCGNSAWIYGERRSFSARVEFTSEFTYAPEAWVRWAESDGIDTRYKFVNSEAYAYYDAFNKDIIVNSVDREGLDISGSYWDVTYYTSLGQSCGTGTIPKSPSNFQIAYTAIGTEGPPPSPPSAPTNLVVNGSVGQNPQLSWTASSGATSYKVYRCTSSTSYCPSYSYVGGSTTTSFVDYNKVLGNACGGGGDEVSFYRVKATNSGGDSGDSNTAGSCTDPSKNGDIEGATAIPANFALHGNYPNPFNPSTEIRFDLPEATHARLVIYDAMGREVGRLLDGSMEAGSHSVSWNAADLPSGVYVYRLDAGEFSQTLQMVLTK